MEGEAAETVERRGVDVRGKLKKATGHDFKDEFTSFVDAATTVMTGVHAEMKALDKTTRDDLAKLRIEQDEARQEAAIVTAEAIEQMRQELAQKETERLAHRDIHDNRLAYVRQRMHETRDASAQAVNAASAMEARFQEVLTKHQLSSRWMIGLSASALVVSIAALVAALT